MSDRFSDQARSSAPLPGTADLSCASGGSGCRASALPKLPAAARRVAVLAAAARWDEVPFASSSFRDEGRTGLHGPSSAVGFREPSQCEGGSRARSIGPAYDALAPLDDRCVTRSRSCARLAACRRLSPRAVKAGKSSRLRTRSEAAAIAPQRLAEARLAGTIDRFVAPWRPSVRRFRTGRPGCTGARRSPPTEERSKKRSTGRLRSSSLSGKTAIVAPARPGARAIACTLRQALHAPRAAQ